MGPDDLSEYCRQVEDHLTRANGGHLVRIVGAGFELVRQWAESGVPLTVVCRGIDLKADRHRLGRSQRPLRIEFCEDDVRDVFAAWRRAVGVTNEAPPKSPPLTKHLDRAIERLSRVAGRLELPPAFLESVSGSLAELIALRDEAKGARGPAREEFAARAAAIDGRLAAAARGAAPEALLASLAADAARELAPFRQRLGAGDWDQAVNVTVDRLLRDHFGLPTI